MLWILVKTLTDLTVLAMTKLVVKYGTECQHVLAVELSPIYQWVISANKTQDARSEL